MEIVEQSSGKNTEPLREQTLNEQIGRIEEILEMRSVGTGKWKRLTRKAKEEIGQKRDINNEN